MCVEVATLIQYKIKIKQRVCERTSCHFICFRVRSGQDVPDIKNKICNIILGGKINGVLKKNNW